MCRQWFDAASYLGYNRHRTIVQNFRLRTALKNYRARHNCCKLLIAMNKTSKATKILPSDTSHDAPKVAPRFGAAVQAAPSFKEPKKTNPRADRPVAKTPVPVTTIAASRVPRWVLATGIGTLALLVSVGGVAYGTYANWVGQGQIARGVWIQGVEVGGLTQAEAKARLQDKFGREKVVLKTSKRDFHLPLSKLGGRLQFDQAVKNAYWFGRAGALTGNVMEIYDARSRQKRLSLPVKWDKTQMRRTMYSIAAQFHEDATDARLIMGANGLETVPEVSGRTINNGATLAALQKAYYAGYSKPITATIKSVAPRVVEADLAGRNVLLGKYTTSFNDGEWGRTRNLHVASEAVDGRVLMPGEAFSFNKSTGERTWDKGYRMGHIFQRQPGAAKSEVVDGLAGGVCQVSSTLYNAVRKANVALPSGVNIALVERNHHSLPVSYVPTGLDATVAWPDKDLRFRNTLEYPIFLRAKINGSQLSVNVWGHIPDGKAAPVEDVADKDARQAFNF